MVQQHIGSGKPPSFLSCTVGATGLVRPLFCVCSTPQNKRPITNGKKPRSTWFIDPTSSITMLLTHFLSYGLELHKRKIMRRRLNLGCSLQSYLTLFIIMVLFSEASSSGQNVAFSLHNRFGSDVALSWVNQQTRNTKSMGNIESNQKIHLNSFVGHEFQINEISSDSSRTDCPQNANGKCREKVFKITEIDSHTILILPGLNVEIENKSERSKTKSQEWEFQEQESETISEMLRQDFPDTIEGCQSEAKDRLAIPVDLLPKTKDAVIDQWRQCIEHHLAEQLEDEDEKTKFQTNIRRELSNRIENYTCVDPDLDSTPDLEERDWINERDGKKRLVHIKLDRPASRIHVVEDFATEQECAAMEKSVQSRLRDATTADGKGGSKLSPGRKAKQSSVTPNWSKEADGDPIATLSRRVYDYTNHVLGLNITEHGQEPLMSIQYFGRGYDDTEPDRYTPHCDGQCDGSKHNHGTRMATVVIYCKIPELGGHTNFQNAAVHVKPDAGNAVFFGYINPETKDMDIGLTQHSGCPVYEGEKKIITQWVRYGVDAANPHHSFNTLGIKSTEAIH